MSEHLITLKYFLKSVVLVFIPLSCLSYSDLEQLANASVISVFICCFSALPVAVDGPYGCFHEKGLMPLIRRAHNTIEGSGRRGPEAHEVALMPFGILWMPFSESCGSLSRLQVRSLEKQPFKATFLLIGNVLMQWGLCPPFTGTLCLWRVIHWALGSVLNDALVSVDCLWELACYKKWLHLLKCYYVNEWHD